MGRKTTLLFATTLLALPALAQAEPVSGLYVGAAAGLNLRQTVTSTVNQALIPSSGSSSQTTSRTSFRAAPGYAGIASLGWGFGNGLRAEVEGNYRGNDVRGSNTPFSNTGGTVSALGRASSVHGNLRSYGGMLNAYYDFHGLIRAVTPYVGIGIGYAYNEWSHVRANGLTSSAVPYEIDAMGGGSALAWQGIAGAAFSLNGLVPGLSLTTEARYYGTAAPGIHNSIARSAEGVSTTTRTSLKPNNHNASVMVGLRYAFGGKRAAVPVPAAAAAAAQPVRPPIPAPTRTFVVFFDWDRTDLTARARDIVTAAANNALRGTSTRIEVSGHTDRSGDAAYNQRLSQRRAEAVAEALVKDGLERNAITVQAFGESRPLVLTADQVREPQNRRVEIVLK